MFSRTISRTPSRPGPRRSTPMRALVAPLPPPVTPVYETDSYGVERLQYQPGGHEKHIFKLDGNEFVTNFVRANEAPAGASPVLLIHGFGASSQHWRYNIPALAKEHPVFAMDMVGFGFSEKAIVDYTGGEIWIKQACDFIETVIGEPVYIAGNSLGGYVSLATAAERPDLVKGVVLLNAAGRFEEELDGEAASRPTEGLAEEEKPFIQRYLVTPITDFFKRIVISFSFIYTKQPLRIEQVLTQVYTEKQNVDASLVRSIADPAQDPNAPEVFFRVITKTSSRTTMNQLLRKLDRPLLLLWGQYDPWIKPSKADLIQKILPSAERVDIPAGHCPHDDLPAPVNKAFLEWMRAQDAKAEAGVGAVGSAVSSPAAPPLNL